MATIQSLPPDCLLHLFSYLKAKDTCALSRVCRQWYRLTRLENVPAHRERLDRIAYHNVTKFDHLPRIRLDLKLRTFAVFQDRIVGETLTGHLCIYHPITGATSLLDYQPPYPSAYPGNFLISSEACVYRFSGSHFYQIDVMPPSYNKIPFRSIYRERAVLKKKLYCWEFDLIPGIFEERSRKRRFFNFFAMKIFNLEDRSITELSYPTIRRPHIFLSEDRFILKVSYWIYILDENLRQIGSSTFCYFQPLDIYLFGKKVLMEATSFDCQGGRSLPVRYMKIKDIGDNSNSGEESVDLPFKTQGKLHSFFIEGLGWKFLHCEGIKWNRTIWSLEQEHLTCVPLAQRVL